MMTLSAVFWLFVGVFAVVGSFRGWAKELLVLFSLILALFLLYVLERYVPGANAALDFQAGLLDPGGQVIVRGFLFFGLAYFGYQTPNLRALQKKSARENLQDAMLGIVIGGINGYFLFGSLWYYAHLAGYPWPDLVTPPNDFASLELLAYMPPVLLGEPAIFFAVGLAFVFVIIVFI